jgi:hypothetical protein
LSIFQQNTERIIYILNNLVKTYPKEIFFDVYDPDTILKNNKVIQTEFWKLTEQQCETFINHNFMDLIRATINNLNITNENEQFGLEQLVRISLISMIRQFQAFEKLKTIISQSRELIDKEKECILPYHA